MSFGHAGGFLVPESCTGTAIRMSSQVSGPSTLHVPCITEAGFGELYVPKWELIVMISAS